VLGYPLCSPHRVAEGRGGIQGCLGHLLVKTRGGLVMVQQGIARRLLVKVR
jgi:hypothetical protein